MFISYNSMNYLNVPYSDFSGRLSLTKSGKEAILKFMFLPYFFNGPSKRKVGNRLHFSNEYRVRTFAISFFCLIIYL
jgi:hypothetical protein